MKLYEGMFLINPELDEAAVSKEVEAIKNEIVKEKGEIDNVINLGRRKMTYDIQKKSQALYMLIIFKIDTQAIDGLKKKFNLDQNLLRALFFIKDRKLPLNEIKE